MNGVKVQFVNHIFVVGIVVGDIHLRRIFFCMKRVSNCHDFNITKSTQNLNMYLADKTCADDSYFKSFHDFPPLKAIRIVILKQRESLYK